MQNYIDGEVRENRHDAQSQPYFFADCSADRDQQASDRAAVAKLRQIDRQIWRGHDPQHPQEYAERQAQSDCEQRIPCKLMTGTRTARYQGR